MSSSRGPDAPDHEWRTRVIAELDAPLEIASVESIEASVKRAWAFVATAPPSPNQALDFVEFFLNLGFLHKLKPYGTKFSAPFGYSLFELHDGQGFSIQLHEQEKIEAFHILEVGDDAFVLAGSVDEWARHGSDMLERWRAGRPTDSPLAYRPEPGDVIVINDLNTVHTVVGCVLEEFANTSYDVVTRLHDQNARSELSLPAQNPTIRPALERIGSVAPRRVVFPGTWDAAPVNGPIVNLSAKGLVGRNLAVSAGSELNRRVGDNELHTIVALAGDVRLSLFDTEFVVELGTTTAIPPGVNYSIGSVESEARVAVAEVSAEIAFADLRDAD